jgi:hypothetical protein
MLMSLAAQMAMMPKIGGKRTSGFAVTGDGQHPADCGVKLHIHLHASIVAEQRP